MITITIKQCSIDLFSILNIHNNILKHTHILRTLKRNNHTLIFNGVQTDLIENYKHLK